MNFYALSGLINGLTSTAVGVYVCTRQFTDRRYQTYGLFCLSLAVWSYSYCFWHLSANAEQALFWVRLLMAGAIFIPITNLHHVLELLSTAGKCRAWIACGYAICLVFLYLDLFSDSFVAGVAPKLGFAFWPIAGPAFTAFLLFFVACVAYFTYRLVHAARQSSGIRKNQLKYLICALALGYLGGATNFPLWYGVPVLPVGNILVSVYVLLFIYAVAKFRLLDIEILIKRGLIHTFTLLALLIPCYGLMLASQRYAFGVIDYSFSALSLVLLLVVAFLFPRFRFRTEEALERVLFKKRTGYRETLLRSSQEMVSVVDLKALCESLVQTVWRTLGIDKVSLFLLDEGKGTFCEAAQRGFDGAGVQLPLLPSKSAVPQALAARREPVVREEVELTKGEVSADEIVDRMKQLQAEICVPIISQHKLIGILNLGNKAGKEIYSNEELELLCTLANQAAVAIENARLYENLRQSQHTLRRADRLSSLGLLTAGLAHEIRNPLVAIRTFTQLLPERYDDPEFREGFQGLALKEVDRICGLINDLLSFARPSRPNVAEENMNDVVDGIARILETEAKEKSVEIRRDFAAELPKVWIDREQLKQVFMNLILNAIQAMKNGGSIVVSTRLKNASSEPGRTTRLVEVEVRDTGIGIPEENLEHIFDPFFTSKDEGSGLGLSISHQIIQEHGGFIFVRSKVGEGTAFFVNLPTGKPVRPPIEIHKHIDETHPSSRQL